LTTFFAKKLTLKQGRRCRRCKITNKPEAIALQAHRWNGMLPLDHLPRILPIIALQIGYQKIGVICTIRLIFLSSNYVNQTFCLLRQVFKTWKIERDG
jgi:hypothetical protein